MKAPRVTFSSISRYGNIETILKVHDMLQLDGVPKKTQKQNKTRIYCVFQSYVLVFANGAGLL